MRVLVILLLFSFSTYAQDTFQAHSGSVNSIRFSPNGLRLLTCGEDNTAKIWNLATKQLKVTFSSHSQAVIAGSFSPDGSIVVTSSNDKWINVWDAKTGNMIRSFGKEPLSGMFPKDLLYSQLEFANDTDLIAKGAYVLGNLYQINTFNAHSGEKLSSISSKEFFISMAVFPDGETVLAESSNYGGTSALSIYDLGTGQKKDVLATGINDQYVAVSPNGKHIAMAGSNRKLSLFDVVSGLKLYEQQIGFETIKNVVFSPDGQTIITAGGKDISLFHTQTGIKIKTITCESTITSLDTYGKLLAVGFENGKVSVYNTLFELVKEIKAITPAANSAKLAFANLSSEPMIVFERGIHQARVPAVKYTKDGSQIITASWDKTIRIWDAKTGNQQRVIRVPAWEGMEGQIFSMDLSADNKYIITAGASLGIRNEVKTSDYIGEYVLLIDFLTGKILDVQGVHKQTIQSIAFSPDGNYVVSGGGETDSRVVVFKVDKSKSKLVKTAERDMAEASKGFYPSCEERGFFGGLCSNRIIGVAFVPGSNEVVSIDMLGMLIKHSKDMSSFKLIGESLNRKSAGSLGKISNNAMFRVLTVDPKGRYVAAGDNSGLVTLFDLKNTVAKALVRGKSFEKKLISIPSFGNHLMAMETSPDGSKLAIATDNKINIYPIDLTSTPKNISVPTIQFSHKEDVMDLAFSPDGKFLVSTGMNPEECFIWDLTTGKQQMSLAPKAKFELLSALGTSSKYPNQIGFGRGLSATVGVNYFGRVSKSFDMAKLEIQKIKNPYSYKGAKELTRGTTPPSFNSPLNDELKTYLPLSNGHTIIGSSYGLYLDNYLNPISLDGLATYGLTSSSDKKQFITGLENGLIRMYNATDASLEASLFVNENDDWVLWTPDGYYTASLKGAQSVAWQTNLGATNTPGLYPFEQFDLILNRPDLVLQKLGSADPDFIRALYKAYLKRLRKMDLVEEDMKATLELPSLQVNYVSQQVSSRKISVAIKAKDKSGLKRIFVYINDVPVFGQKGIVITGIDYSSNITLELSPGVNKIQFAALNSFGVTSLTETRYVTLKAPKTKGHLYVVAIGVSDYKNDDFDLSYAAKDATDLINLMATHTEDYNGFTPILITDSNATKEAILKVKETLMNTSVDDHIILFAAGHGLLDENFNYYFATHDIDFYNPAGRGLIYEDLESLLDGIPARKKLLLIDACNSGEVDEEEIAILTTKEGNSNTEVHSRGFKNITKKKIGLEKSVDLMQKYFNDLRKGTGAMVISSASGVEFAFESSIWQNGVFTYAMLAGLKSGKCDANNDGEIRVSELRNYVFDKVAELTGGEQHPTSRRENLEFDFVVW